MKKKIEGFSKLAWERIEDIKSEYSKNHQMEDRVERAKVPGGWLVRAYSETAIFEGAMVAQGVGVGVGLGITFVPDPAYAWVV